MVSPEGKPATTIFNFVSYCEKSNTSIVEARPITGRTHQIRVHLQYIGYPIFRDPLYGNSHWGADGGKGILSKERAQLIIKEFETKKLNSGECSIQSHYKDFQDFVCPDCAVPFLDPQPEDLFIYLHALRYQGNGWNYSTPLPAWATDEGWDPSSPSSPLIINNTL